MRRSSDEYHNRSNYGGNSKSSMDDYLERLTRMQRTPTIIPDFPEFPNVHEVLNHNTYKEKSGDHRRTNHGGDSKSSMDDYLNKMARMQKRPTMIPDFPEFPNVHEVLNHNIYEEKNGDHRRINSHVNHHKHQVPKHKKVHSDEHQKPAEIDREEKNEGADVEGDGIVHEKHKTFELRKWASIKVY